MFNLALYSVVQIGMLLPAPTPSSKLNIENNGWPHNVVVKQYGAGECDYVDVTFINSSGRSRMYRGLRGEALVLEKQRRLIVISTCPEVRPEYLYFFDSTGKLLKKIEMQYAGIESYRFDEKSGKFCIRFSMNSTKTNLFEPVEDRFDPNGKFIERVEVPANDMH